MLDHVVNLSVVFSAQAIQSIDISCCGTRFATGGLDHNIKVW